MSKYDLVFEKQKNYALYRDYISFRSFAIVLVFGTIILSVAAFLSDPSGDFLLMVGKSVLISLIIYVFVLVPAGQIAKFFSNYYAQLIDKMNVQTIDMIFDSFKNGEGFVFNYFFEDFDRGDIVNVKFGENAGEYIIKPFYNEKNDQMTMMVNSVGISFDDPRYKSLSFSFSPKSAMSD